MLRGLKTLGIRVERAQRSAMEIARWLERQPEVSTVRYIQVDNATPIVLNREKSVTLGILGTTAW